MPAASATRPMRPSSASISRTRWPLPSPPMAGLQDISPMVAKLWVTSAVGSAHARGRSRRLAAGVAAAHHDHVEGPVGHGAPHGPDFYVRRGLGVKSNRHG